MIVTLSLLRLAGAQIVSKDGVPGVYVPIPYNAFVLRKKRTGKLIDIFLKFNLHKANPKYKYTQFGTIIRPDEAKDLMLNSDEVGCKKLEDITMWVFDGGSTKLDDLMSNTDFDEIIK